LWRPQQAAVPVIGFFHDGPSSDEAAILPSFRQGLSE
jgi:hypothetical protein